LEIRGEMRTAELVAALCLATDLGMGFPFEHGLHTTLIGMRLADGWGSIALRRRRRTTPCCWPMRVHDRCACDR
jgi:hypothetical protein